MEPLAGLAQLPISSSSFSPILVHNFKLYLHLCTIYPYVTSLTNILMSCLIPLHESTPIYKLPLPCLIHFYTVCWWMPSQLKIQNTQLNRSMWSIAHPQAKTFFIHNSSSIAELRHCTYQPIPHTANAVHSTSRNGTVLCPNELLRATSFRTAHAKKHSMHKCNYPNAIHVKR